MDSDTQLQTTNNTPAVIPTISLGSLVAWLCIKHGAVKPVIRRFITGYPGGTSYVLTQLVFAQPNTDMSEVPDYLTPARGVVCDLDIVALDPINESQRLLTELQTLQLAKGDPAIPVQYPN